MTLAQSAFSGERGYPESVVGQFEIRGRRQSVAAPRSPVLCLVQGRYSPAVCIKARKRHVEGSPDPAHVSTSYVERANKSLKITPALASGISKTALDWAQIVEMMDADQPAKKRGPYKKQAA